MSGFKIKDLEANERPRERLKSVGAGALTDAELLAIILCTGGTEISAVDLARKILKKSGSIRGLSDLSFEQLEEIPNVGFAKASSIKALCELSLRMELHDSSLNLLVSRPEDVFHLLKKDLCGNEKEVLILISLNSRNRVIAKDTISMGTANDALAHPREIFSQALKRRAISIILAHNHPSDDSMPSKEDILLTQRTAKAGKILGVPLVDHVIVCKKSFASMKALNLFTLYKFDPKEKSLGDELKGGD